MFALIGLASRHFYEKSRPEMKRVLSSPSSDECQEHILDEDRQTNVKEFLKALISSILLQILVVLCRDVSVHPFETENSFVRSFVRWAGGEEV